MARRRRTNKPKRTLSEEQLQKMKEGRERAQKQRLDAAKYKERMEMLSELDKQLAQGRRNAEERGKIRISSRRRRHF
ncbi:hypothetical protein J6A31_07340 [bacterium]|nr:hypothetical protein [bacterium]